MSLLRTSGRIVMPAFLVWLTMASTASAFAQGALPSSVPTPLTDLLKEASAHNSHISAAESAWQAAKEIPPQAGSLPDPKLVFQQFSVGSPKPFAGYTNSDFAYAGIGVSQEIPYPGKLRLRAAEAERAAEGKRAELSAARADVAGLVKADYIELAYLQGTLTILKQNRQALGELVHDATAHYAVGDGAQVDVLEAQLNLTKILRRIAIDEEQIEEVEAHLKGVLHRLQSSPNLLAEPLKESALKLSSSELLQLARTNNPIVKTDQSSVSQKSAALASAKRDTRPDFDVGYMYQNTDRKYRDYYMFTLAIRLPRRGRVHAEIAEAAATLAATRDTLDEHLQEQLAMVKKEYALASSDAAILEEFREGLMPQADAGYQAALSAYAVNRGRFADVVHAFLNVLNLSMEREEALRDHEAALARLETLTGASLR